jgi:3-dehydroquinate synthase/shikimate kinase/3-dehydroquinate synthase
VAASITAQGITVTRVPIADTEATKTFATAEHVAGRLADVALHRDDLVVAVGGEPISDLAGFVAATFNRGTRLALVPTTLVGQADSAVGGKSAINMPQGRNLVGAIHQPAVVIADVTTACENVDHGFRAGLAEIAKHALISRSDLLDVLEEISDDARSADVDAVHRLVTRSVEIKADIVSRDEGATGERIVLNYGHTFGHAIDLVAGQVEDQGESVALGMMAAAHLARRQGRVDDDVVDRHRRLLSDLGLPTSGRFDVDLMQRAWLRDKKYRHGVRFVVLNGLGQAEAGVTASADMLADVLEDLASS